MFSWFAGVRVDQTFPKVTMIQNLKILFIVQVPFAADPGIYYNTGLVTNFLTHIPQRKSFPKNDRLRTLWHEGIMFGELKPAAIFSAFIR